MQSDPQTSPRASRIHESLKEAVRRHRSSHRDIAVGLFEMQEGRFFRSLGYSSVVHYAELEFGFTVRKTWDLVSIGRRLQELEQLDGAFARGEIGWTKVREIARVATLETEQAWLETAGRLSSRKLEALVSRCRFGDDPGAVEQIPDLAPVRFDVTYTLEAVHYDLLARAFARLRLLGGGVELTESQLLGALAESLLSGLECGCCDRDLPSERYRVVVHRCPDCLSTWQETVSSRAEVPPYLAEMVQCDAEVSMGSRSSEEAGAGRGTSCGHRTSRTIPPATRRWVLDRDERRCQAPGCRSRLWKDIHHLKPLCEGGGHDESNLTVLCTLHHELVHQGKLRVERAPDGSLRWFRRDGRPFLDGAAGGSSDSLVETGTQKGAGGAVADDPTTQVGGTEAGGGAPLVDEAATTHVGSGDGGEGEPDEDPRIDDTAPEQLEDPWQEEGFRHLEELLADGALHMDQIIQRMLPAGTGEVISLVGMARLYGKVERLPGGSYRLLPGPDERNWIETGYGPEAAVRLSIARVKQSTRPRRRTLPEPGWPPAPHGSGVLPPAYLAG